MPGALVAALVYGRGYVRAFAIGALPLAVPGAFFGLVAVEMVGSLDADDANTYRIMFGGGLLILLASGLASVAVRWVLLPRPAARPKVAAEIPSGTVLGGRFGNGVPSPADLPALTDPSAMAASSGQFVPINRLYVFPLSSVDPPESE